jgi:CDP-diglyceride synthetase
VVEPTGVPPRTGPFAVVEPTGAPPRTGQFAVVEPGAAKPPRSSFAEMMRPSRPSGRPPSAPPIGPPDTGSSLLPPLPSTGTKSGLIAFPDRGAGPDSGEDPDRDPLPDLYGPPARGPVDADRSQRGPKFRSTPEPPAPAQDALYPDQDLNYPDQDRYSDRNSYPDQDAYPDEDAYPDQDLQYQDPRYPTQNFQDPGRSGRGRSSTSFSGPPGVRTAPEAQAAGHGRAGRNLPAAIGVGVGLGGLASASLFTRPEAFVALASLVVVLAVWELAGAMAAKQIVVPVIPLAVGSLGMLVSAYVAGEEGLLVSFTLTGFGVLLWRIIDGMEGALRDVTAGLFTAAYVPLLAGFAILLLADGPERVVTFIVVTVASDIGGYAAGVMAGRTPMAPTISPKKSWEGFAGSVFACLVVGVACVVLLLDGPWYVGLLLGAASAVCATLGDLSESLLKRDLGVKDMGSLLPGHGGIMDRLDSLLPTAPVAYLLLHFLVSTT